MLKSHLANKFSRSIKPLSKSDKIFTNLYGEFGTDFKSSLERGDWKDTDKVLSHGRQWIIDEVKKSEIRGRGGAGFSAGAKWNFIPKVIKRKKHYLVVNADEGEPGTFKDKYILTYEPHKLLEGTFITSFAIQAHTAYIYIRGEFKHETECLQKAIDELYKEKILGKDNKLGWDMDIHIINGAGAYVCGEETGMLNSIEGLPGRPRPKPPFPATIGLFNCPTLINNVETIASVSSICKRGADWYASLGVKGSKGTKLYGISGCVNNPCIVEEALGVPLRYLIDHYAGGVKGGWENLQAVIPGGLSTSPLLPKDANEALMSYDNLLELDSALGTAGIIVLDKSVDVVDAYLRHASFYSNESCGQCAPCRRGTENMATILEKINKGNGTMEDVASLEEVAKTTRGCQCALADAASGPIKGLLKNFRAEVLAKIKK